MLTKILLTGAAALALAVSLTACSSGSNAADPSSTSPSTSPSTSSFSTTSPDTSAKDARTGTFAGLKDKKVAGTATFADGKLNLAGFSSDEGPDLHVYLANGTDEAAVAAGTEIDGVKWNASTQSFDLKGVDSSAYSYVVIHCDKAKAVFGAAQLS